MAEVMELVWETPRATGRWFPHCAACESACRGIAAFSPSASGDFEDRLDLDRCAERQLSHPDRAAGVLTALAEHLNEQVGRAVDHRRLFGEVGRAVDETGELHNLIDVVERVELGPRRRDEVDSSAARQREGFVARYLRSN